MNPIIAIGTALWLGLLSSVSPCPLAMNLAAVSYVSRSVSQPLRVIIAGLLYTLGRMVAYAGLATLLVTSLVSSPVVSQWLQEHLNRFLGPILILVGMVLVGLIDFGISGIGLTEGLRRWIDRFGISGAALLGFIFALSFCPVSAALYFGSLIPLAIREESRVSIPAAFGIGTAVPVLVFAGLLAFGSKWVGAMFQRVTAVEWYVRMATGAIVLFVGIYLTLHHVWNVIP